MTQKVAFHTLGCKVNYYETEALKGQFLQEGFEPVNINEKADVYVFNTCTVTHLADRKSRQAIRRAKRKNPQALVAVIGCYPQVQPEDLLAMEEVDLILGTANRMELPKQVKKALADQPVKADRGVHPTTIPRVFEEMPWQPGQGRTRAFLKIQDGCDHFCSYCIVPIARGPLRSLPPERVLHYLREIGRAGYREVVLTGVHLGLYGVDLDPPLNLAELLGKTGDIQGIERFRLSSIEPADISPELVQVVKDDNRICPHLHVPLQSGDDQVLEAMKRPYNTMQFYYLVQYLHAEIDDLAISTDIIVGFPGEEAVNFHNTYTFVKKCQFSRLHVFKYSPRKGTPAAEMQPQVPPKEKEDRSRQMIELGEQLALNYQGRFLGRTLPVLLESRVSLNERPETEKSPPAWEGLTPNYLRVRLPCQGASQGEVCPVRLEASLPGYVLGKRTYR